ncbi:MAG: hypothetical protein ACREIU_10100 [Planctomycetota bacterium]
MDSFRDPEGDPVPRWWIWILGVRDDDLGPLDEFADSLASDLYGPDPVPFYVHPVGRRRTRKFLADRAAREKRAGARVGGNARRARSIADRRRTRAARTG